ncbi:unnamed protein product [Ostreobium quekettii]|uniref:BZIP domain-containing protein n=1 Tax=Ostreobium quekettii TaxID=121088 RepID=A0A8S1J1G4_9CHLO|nr:unnamed protein product [Ostreobium quekettii]
MPRTADAPQRGGSLGVAVELADAGGLQGQIVRLPGSPFGEGRGALRRLGSGPVRPSGLAPPEQSAPSGPARSASWPAGTQGFREDVDRDERRRERNRRAQRVFREKQRKRIAALEGDSSSLREKVRALSIKNTQIKRENANLKKRMNEVKKGKMGGVSGGQQANASGAK